MGEALRPQLGNRHRHSASLGNFVQRLFNVWREHDDARATPAATAAGGCIADDLHRATGRGYSAQLSGGKESDQLAVGRPERKCRTVRPRYWPGLAGLEVANPKLR